MRAGSGALDRPALTSSLRSETLARRTVLALVAGTVSVSLGLFAATPLQGVADFVVFTAAASMVVVGVVSWRVEGRRRAVNRMATTGALTALALTLLPLGVVIGYTIFRGAKRLNGGFLTHSMAGITQFSPGGGVYHAIIGTLEQVALASAIAVPLGLLVAIYVTEYGRNWFGTAVRFLVDVMTGIPSVVAGLFVLAFWVYGLHQSFSGFAAALALAVLELPVIVRAAEEMLRLVPRTLREASYALGVPKWKTVLRIVLPTAASGITTGVMLAVARAAGETAPVLLAAGNNFFINSDPFHGGQASLPVYIFLNARSSNTFDVDRAWAAALTLIVIVIVLYVAARLLTRRNALARR